MMNNKRFVWSLIAICLTCIIIAAVWKYPDAVKANASKEIKLGEYIYIDPRSTIHVSRKCPKLNYKGWKSQRVKVEDMPLSQVDLPKDEATFCPHCVNDRDYEMLTTSHSSN